MNSVDSHKLCEMSWTSFSNELYIEMKKTPSYIVPNAIFGDDVSTKKAILTNRILLFLHRILHDALKIRSHKTGRNFKLKDREREKMMMHEGKQIW